MGKHSIMVIKKNNKYLQYFEERWNSYLFLNCKLGEDLSIEIILNNLKERFNTENIDCQYIGEKVHTKFSEKDKVMKEYDHHFYLIYMNDLSDDDFVLDGVKYKWFSMEELENDKRIQEVNSDVVGYIKEFNI